MNLQAKSILVISLVIAFTCACMGFLGYNSADSGFARSLEMKAQSNVLTMAEIMNFKYPGEWHVSNGALFKGETNMSGANDVVDYFGNMMKGHVTIFLGDTRVSTTVKRSDGARSVGSKASEAIINEVLKGGKSFTGKAEVVGKTYYSAYEPLKDSKGNVIGMLFVGLPESEMDDIYRTFIIEIIVSTIIITLILAVGVNLVIRKTINFVTSVSSTLEEVAKGNLKVNDLPVDSSDELGKLASATNDMKKYLKTLLKNVRVSAEAVAASAEQFMASASQTAESIQHVASSTVQMAESTTNQAGTINSLKDNITDMRQKVDDLSQSARTMDDAAKATQDNATTGRQTVAHAIEEIQSIAEQVNTSAEMVRSLGEQSKEIDSIVRTISEIAEQTNLLALNAAIEAARAGEAGRGFTVVADEVRKLAEGCGTAASSISQLVMALQNKTKDAVDLMEIGNQKVQEGAESIKATGEAFKSIEDQVDRLSSNITQSISYIGIVSGTSNTIESSIEAVQHESQTTNERAQNVSAATEEQAATMQEMTDASHKLADLATNLQNEVAKFKI